MYVDPTGDFAIFTSMLFTSILFGFVTGALSTGYKAKKDNLSLENVILAFLILLNIYPYMAL
mgnify:CR=1 FL=1